MALWILKPDGYFRPGTSGDPAAFVKNKYPIAAVFQQMGAGDNGFLMGGVYNRVTLTKSPREPGLAPVKFYADFEPVTISRLPEVGSSDGFLMKQGVRDLILENLTIQAASRAGLKSEQPGGLRKITLIKCKIRGAFDATIQGDRSDELWGDSAYFNGSIAWVDCEVSGIFKEHARYHHTLQGNLGFTGTLIRHCGRAALQEVNRIHENGTPQPPGYGRVTIEREIVVDVCFDGAHAYSFRGGRPGGETVIRNTVIELGCDPNLAPEWRGKAAGAILMDVGKESKPGFGDMAHPGKYKSLLLDGVVVDIGKVYPGTGSWLRDAVILGNCEQVIITGGSYSLVGNRTTIDINPTVTSFKMSRSTVVNGVIDYHGEKYQTPAEFFTAHPECVA